MGLTCLLDRLDKKRLVLRFALALVALMAGFSKMEQAQFSLLVLAHRSTLYKLRGMVERDVDWMLLIALRLPVIRAWKKKSTFNIELDTCRLSNPLTTGELRAEVKD